MKIESIVVKVSRVYYTDSGTYLRVVEQHGEAPQWYIQDFEGDWVAVCQYLIDELQEAEEVFDLKLK
jgi:hypothetical protein